MYGLWSMLYLCTMALPMPLRVGGCVNLCLNGLLITLITAASKRLCRGALT